MFKILVRVLVAFLLLSVGSISSQINPAVELKFGKVIGSPIEMNDVVISRFLGIPYAEPPLGDLRFKKPKPLAPISRNTMNANQWPHLCPQETGFDFVPYLMTINEDCLYLNIWTPFSPDELRSESKLKPVLVFIHGGGFVGGSVSHALFDGSKLAAHGDLLVVTINYRLGALGFLYGNNESAPGNLGLWDQLLALEWIQDNIRYFGGDPQKVTVSGESSGACSIAMYLTSQPTEHLFDKAFLMSGVPFEKFSFISKTAAIQRTHALVVLVGCRKPPGNTNLELTQVEVDCLQQVEVDVLLKAQSHVSLDHDYLTFLPIYGDTLLTEHPMKSILNHNLSNRKVLLGTLVNEGIIYALFIPPLNVNENMSVSEATDKVFSILESSYGPSSRISKAMIESIYFHSTDLDLREQYLNAISDITFNCPTSLMAELLSKDNTVHQYLFAGQPNKSMICEPEDSRPCHGDDLYVLFGNLINSEEDIKMSQAWMDIVVAFIKNEPMAWPKYEHFDKRNTAPYYVFRGKEGNEVRQGFRHFECQFWKDLHI